LCDTFNDSVKANLKIYMDGFVDRSEAVDDVPQAVEYLKKSAEVCYALIEKLEADAKEALDPRTMAQAEKQRKRVI